MALNISNILFLIVLIGSCAPRKSPIENQTNVEYTDKSEGKTMPVDSSASDQKPNTIISESNKYFRLLSATSEPWVGGARGSGNGIEYYFKMLITTGEELKFGKVWTTEKTFDSYLFKAKKEITGAPVTFIKGDTIFVRVSDLQNMKPQKQAPPFNFQGDALMEYILNGNKNYFVVNKIEKLPTLYKP